MKAIMLKTRYNFGEKIGIDKITKIVTVETRSIVTKELTGKVVENYFNERKYLGTFIVSTCRQE